MASLIYNSAIEDMARGVIDFDTHTFKVILVSSVYSANKDTHSKRSDVTGEITGPGYIPGGIVAGMAVAKNIANDKIIIQIAGVEWANSTITARGCVYYRFRGTGPSTEELVAYNDFGFDVSSSLGSLIVSPSTITLQN